MWESNGKASCFKSERPNPNDEKKHQLSKNQTFFSDLRIEVYFVIEKFVIDH